MDTIELIERLAVALAIGLVIGIERGWKQREEGEGDRAAGLRTHALSGLLGGVWGALALRRAPGGTIALGLAFAAFAAAIIVFRYREMIHDKTFGATTGRRRHGRFFARRARRHGRRDGGSGGGRGGRDAARAQGGAARNG